MRQRNTFCINIIIAPSTNTVGSRLSCSHVVGAGGMSVMGRFRETSKLRAAASPLARLSPRQREVLDLVARGLTNQGIADVLKISSETVRTHVTAIIARLEVSNRTEATAAYLSWEAAGSSSSGTPTRPAIAVLPLFTLDAEPYAASTATGFSQNLIAMLVRAQQFPVIAHAYTKGAYAIGGTTLALGEQLGARFLLDGALRFCGPQGRLSACLADTANGHCMWADNYDFPRDALLAAQDQICQAIVGAVHARLGIWLGVALA